MQYLISQEKKILQILPFFFILKKCHMEMTSYAKARSNMYTLNDATTEK
jgi:hypothetical protein